MLIKKECSNEEPGQHTPTGITSCSHRSQKFETRTRKLEITSHKENPIDRFIVRPQLDQIEETLTAFCR